MVAAAALCCLATLGCEDPASDPGDEIVFGGVRDTYPCAADGSQFSARITNDDDWEKFHFSGCSEVRDLVLLGDLADFGGRAPVPVLVLGDLIVRGTQLEALSKTDDLGRCAGRPGLSAGVAHGAERQEPGGGAPASEQGGGGEQ